MPSFLCKDELSQTGVGIFSGRWEQPLCVEDVFYPSRPVEVVTVGRRLACMSMGPHPAGHTYIPRQDILLSSA